MVGVFQFTPRENSGAAAAAQTGQPSAIVAVAAGGLLALALLAARAASAETGGTDSRAPAPGAGPTRAERVSTSPEAHPVGSSATTRPARPMRVIEDEPPLTRAAARQRVESMSPAQWLERFGPVVVERRE